MPHLSTPTASPRVYVIHENPEWIPPFADSLTRAGVDFTLWPLTSGSVDLSAEPPRGVFWSRLSASAHTRGNAHSKEYGRALLAWLEAHGRRVVNGSSVLEFEVSKVRQYLALQGAGFDVPKTVAVFGTEELLERASELPVPFITKHNQGGKGLGVRRFDSHGDFAEHVASQEFEPSVDGITLLQEYVASAEPFITRAEFVGGRFHYAARVDTSAGSFELCPADACEVPGAASAGAGHAPFEIRPEITADHPLVRRLKPFLAENGIELAGVEFIETPDGRFVVYDVNTNTNYNSALEATAPQRATDRVAEFLKSELENLGE